MWHKYWRQWCTCHNPLRINPFLQTTSAKEVILAKTRLTDNVQKVYYGNGKCVTVQTPQVSLSAIYKAIDMKSGVSPIYPGENKFIFLIQCQIQGWKREDLPPTHKISVPVATVNIAYKIGNERINALSKATGQLFTVAFYFLLWIG